MTTARQLIQGSMIDIGALDANETMDADQANQGLRVLNRIIDQWRASRLYVWAIKEVVANVTGQSATIGPTGTFVTPHPQKLWGGCYYVRNGQSWPLEVLERESWDLILTKAQSGNDMTAVYYDRQIPGTVYFWTSPSTATEVHLQVLVQLPEFSDLDTDVSLPDGYYAALAATLNEKLPRVYGLPVDPLAPREGATARRIIKRANVDIPLMNFDSRLPTGGWWNNGYSY